MLKQSIPYLTIIAFFIGIFMLVSCSQGTVSGKTGEELFKQKCVRCHPGGSNMVKPEKTLYKKDIQTYGIITVDDVVRYLRNPGTGMPTFDENVLSDKQARAIARYLLETFK